MLGWFSLVALRLGRADQRPEAKPGTVAALDAVQARVLDARPDVDLVARRRLPGQPQRPVLPRAVVDRLLALVRVVGPFRGIARVLVDKHAGDILLADLVAVRAEEPQLVTDDRAAERRIDVPQLLDRVRCRQPLGLHLRREVVALERAARAAHEEAAGEPVAALLADDVHLRAAGGRLAKPAAQAEHHFLRVADLGHVARHAHALVAAVHAVDEDLSLVPAPAVDLEHAVECRVGAFDIIRPER